MNANDIVFNEDFELSYYSKDLKRKFFIILLDDLVASEEELTDDYKNKIANFINNLEIWYPFAINAIQERANTKYNSIASEKDIQLMSIFILFEQDQDELYGLEFRTEFDIEHGCGLQILSKNYEIIEIGSADVAFSI